MHRQRQHQRRRRRSHGAGEQRLPDRGPTRLVDYPGDLGSQIDEIVTSLYYESNGVFNSTPYAGAECFPDLTNAQGCDPTSGGVLYSATQLTANNKGFTPTNILNNNYPTARTLFNVYNTGNLNASAAGFVNWVCDSQTAITKQKDNSSGVNFDNELTSIIGSYGFQRLTDTSKQASAGATPADGVTNGGSNVTCAGGTVPSGSTVAGNGRPPAGDTTDGAPAVTNPNS